MRVRTTACTAVTVAPVAVARVLWSIACIVASMTSLLAAVGAETLAATMRLPDVIVRVMADGATPRRPASPFM